MAVVVGVIIGSGIFRVPSPIAAAAGSLTGIALVWILGGIVALFGALSVAELATMYPAAGGPYVYLREAYGRPLGIPVRVDVAADDTDLVGGAELDVRGIPGVLRADSRDRAARDRGAASHPGRRRELSFGETGRSHPELLDRREGAGHRGSLRGDFRLCARRPRESAACGADGHGELARNRHRPHCRAVGLRWLGKPDHAFGRGKEPAAQFADCADRRCAGGNRGVFAHQCGVSARAVAAAARRPRNPSLPTPPAPCSAGQGPRSPARW